MIVMLFMNEDKHDNEIFRNHFLKFKNINLLI